MTLTNSYSFGSVGIKAGISIRSFAGALAETVAGGTGLGAIVSFFPKKPLKKIIFSRPFYGFNPIIEISLIKNRSLRLFYCFFYVLKNDQTLKTLSYQRF
jgi:hypothetical protein